MQVSYHFDSIELDKIIMILNGSGPELFNVQSRLCYSYQKLASIVQSEDSNLSDTYRSISKTVELIAHKINKLCESLSYSIEMYKTSTISNEQTASNIVDHLNTQLDDINSMLDSLGTSGNPMN